MSLFPYKVLSRAYDQILSYIPYTIEIIFQGNVVYDIMLNYY